MKYDIPLNFTQENEKTNENELPESFYDLILEIAAYGKENLDKARELQSSVPKYTNIVLLQLNQAEYFYKNLESYNFKIFEKNSRKIFWPKVFLNMIQCVRKGKF